MGMNLGLSYKGEIINRECLHTACYGNLFTSQKQKLEEVG
jgi:hypothetical protein